MRARARCTVGTAAVIVSLLLAAAATTSCWYTPGYRLTPRAILELRIGSVRLIWTDPPAFVGADWNSDGSLGFGWGRVGSWRPPLRDALVPRLDTGGGLNRAVMPLWCLLVPSLALAAIALRTRGRQTLLCPSCDYDLRGNTTGVCPECGRGTAPSSVGDP